MDPERWQAALEMLWLEPGALDPQRPTRVFSEMLERVGIPWLDLTAPIAAALAGGETIYYQRDRHWTARGHALAARHLARFLWERGLLLGPGQTDQPVAAGLRVGRLDGRQRDADR